MNGLKAEFPRVGAKARLLLFGLIAIASVAVGFLLVDAAHAQVLVKRWGYYGIGLTFAWAAVAGCSALPDITRGFRGMAAGEKARLWIVIGLCALIAALTVRFTYKVLYDEMVLQATAWNMHFSREASTVLRGYRIDGFFAPLDAYVDKRPLFFTFLISLLHDVVGYREANAFGFNFALLPLVLFQLYCLARRLAPPAASLAALAAFGTLSLLAHNATGAGMEMLNLAMLLGSLHAAIAYLEQPTEKRLTLLILVVVLLAQTRYESSLYVAPAALVILEGWRRARRPLAPLALILAPLLLVPYAIHNTYLSGTPLLWELRDHEQTRFSVAHFWANLRHAGAYFFAVSRLMTNSAWLSATGFAGLLYGAICLWRGRGDWRHAPAPAFALTCFGIGILANLLLLMFYYWGQLDDPIVGRLSLPAYALITLALAYATGRLERVFRPASAVVAAGAIGILLVTGLGANAQHVTLNTLERELLWERQFVAAQSPGDRLIITNKSALPWMLCRKPAIAIELARTRVSALRRQLDQREFKEILVFQGLRPASPEGEYVLNPTDRLPDWFVLEPLAERRFGARLCRVSRLVAINAPPDAAVQQ